MTRRIANKVTRSTCPYCGVGCGVEVTTDGDAVEPVRGDADHPANAGRLCVKGSSLHETLGHSRRLLEPRIDGAAASWEQALDTVSGRLQDTLQRHGPGSVALYLSGQLLTEDYYVANKLWKGYLGSANVDTNSRLCMASAVAAHVRAFGEDVVPGCYEDVEEADLVVLVGSNAAWAHPVLFQRLQEARSRRGTRLVVIDPRRTATCDSADLHLPVAPGTDAWLFNGLLAHLDASGNIDADYIAAHTRDFDATLAAARRSAGKPQQVARRCGLELADLQRFYHWFAGQDRTVTMFSQGVNQSSSGTDKGNAIINCHLATGRVGRPGASPFSITGQPNAMGGREVGGLANQLAVHRGFGAEDVAAVQQFWQAPNMAGAPGLKALDLFEAVERGRVKFLWIMATNPIATLPEADRWQRALEKCDTVVVSDCVADTETTAVADILLPAAGWGEKDGTVTNSERRISRQRAFLPPAGESRPDWWMVTEVARRLGHGAAFAYRQPQEIFAEYAALSGINKDHHLRFDISSLAPIDAAAYDALEPLQWPSGGTDARRLFGDGHFATPDGRARFVAVTPKTAEARPRRRRPLILNTGRTRDHWHTLTRSAESLRLSQHRNEPFLELHSEDARELGIKAGDIAEVSGQGEALLLRAVLEPGQARGSVFAPMHWSRPYASSARVGNQIPAVRDPHSGQPELKHATVAVTRWPLSWQALLLCATPIEIPGDGYWAAHPLGSGWCYRIAGRDDPAAACAELRHRLGGAVLLHYEEAGHGMQRMIAFDEGRLHAALLFQAGSTPLPSRWAAVDSRLGASLDVRARCDALAAAPEDAGAAIRCSCHQVDEASIREAIAAGANSTQALGKRLACGTGCGSCIAELRRLIAEAEALDLAS